jgi:membrane protein required for colicin V production
LNIIDLIILIAFLIGFLLGYKDGFLRKVIGFIGFVLAIVLSAVFRNDFGNFIEKNFDIENYFAKILAAILIFFLILIIFAFLKRIIHPFDKINSLINKLVGGVVGSFQILFFISALFLLLNIFGLPDDKTKKNSNFYNYIYSIIPSTFNLIKEYRPDTEKIIKDIINEKDTTK